MRATLKRLRRDDRGQALAEYAILLALSGGIDRLGRLVNDLVTERPGTVLMGGVVVLAAVLTFTTSRTRY